MRLFSLAITLAAVAASLCALPASAADQDADGVQDAADRCPWVDDRIDLDANGMADCAETMLNGFGFRSEALMLSNYSPSVAFVYEQLTFEPEDDFAGYWGSGAAMVSGGNNTADSLFATQCIPVDHWRNYVAMAQAGSKMTGGTMHELVVREYTGPNCSNQLRMLSSGYYHSQLMDKIIPAIIVRDVRPAHQRPVDPPHRHHAQHDLQQRALLVRQRLDPPAAGEQGQPGADHPPAAAAAQEVGGGRAAAGVAGGREPPKFGEVRVGDRLAPFASRPSRRPARPWAPWA